MKYNLESKTEELYSLTWAEEDIFAFRFKNVAKDPVNWSWVFLELTAAQQWQ